MINLDEVIHTHIVTPRTILNEMLTDKNKLRQIKWVADGESLTVNHDYGAFTLTYDECQHILALWRMRGKV